MDEDDKRLLDGFRAGGEDAFEVLFDRFARVLAHRIRDRLPDRIRHRVSVADVMQETRLAAHQGLGDLAAEDLTGLRAWLLGIADRKAIDLQRRHDQAARRSVRREVPRSARPETRALPGRSDTPSQVAMAGEAADAAQRARASLPADYREVILLVREQGLSIQEAARHMGRSYEATKKLYGRAFCRFKDLFDALRGDDDV